MAKNQSQRMKGYAARVRRLLQRFMLHLFNDKKALKEDIREIGVILMTAGIVSAALDQSKFFDRSTLPGGVSLLVVGLVLFGLGHYDD